MRYGFDQNLRRDKPGSELQMPVLNHKTLPLALYPLIATQGLFVKFRAAQLSEPTGPRNGEEGDGPPIRLLIVGDSSAAGVGVATQAQGLAGQTVKNLAPQNRVTWTLLARCGDTTRDSLQRLTTLPEREFDIVVTALGVNDAKNGVSLAAWMDRTEALHAMLVDRFNARLVIASGLPPVQDFPLLPNPLRQVLAMRCRQFDAALHDISDRREQVVVLPGTIPLRPDLMSEDGFHPKDEVYAEWGRRIGRLVRTHWT